MKSAIRACTVRRPERSDEEGGEADQQRGQRGREHEARIRAHERRCAMRPFASVTARSAGRRVGRQSSPGHAGNARLHLDVRRERRERAIPDQVLATEATSEPGEQLRELTLVGLGIAPAGRTRARSRSVEPS